MNCNNFFCLLLIFATFSCTIVRGAIYLSTGEDVRLFQVGRSLKISCNYTHAQAGTTRFKWYKNESPLSATPEGRVQIEHSEEEISNGEKINSKSFILFEESVQEDVGYYTCRFGTDTYKKVALASTVYQKRLPKSTEIGEGEVLSLECKAYGDEYLSPIIHWEKEGVPLEKAVNSSKLTISANSEGLEDGAFQVADADQSDRGHYTCFATFDSTFIMNTTTNVRVKDPLRVLWPLIGIVAQALVLAFTIFMCETMRRKEGDDDDEDEFPTLAKMPSESTHPQASTSAVNT